METQEVIDELHNPVRLAFAIGQLPSYQRADIANLIDEEQIPGSFGELVKRSLGLIQEGKQLEGGNVVSMVGRKR